MRSGPKGTSRSSSCCRSRRMPHCDEPSGAYPRTVFRRSECIVFLMTRDRFGKLSNMTGGLPIRAFGETRSEEHTSELQSLMRNSYAVFCLKKKQHNTQ